jgi:hypothetical protein
MTKRIGMAALFLVGCAVGGVSGQLVVPKASAEQEAMLTKWQATCARGSWDEMIAAAQKAGAQGWELVSHNADASEYSVCFKRPKL